MVATGGAGSSAIDELASALFALDLRGSTRAVTLAITDAVVKWALARTWLPRVEARVEAATPAGDTRLGFIDVVIRRNDEPDLAIEIDSGDKPWSVEKLRHAARGGMQAVWIRWGDEQWAGVYDDVDVIQLWLPRRPARRPASDQLPIW